MQETQSIIKAIADPHHTAVLVVDVQNLFVAKPSEPPVEEVLPRLHRFIHGARMAGAMIVRIEAVISDAMYSEVCVSSTARDAFQRDFYTITLSDCASCTTLARHESGPATLAGAFGMVCDSADVLGAWRAQHVGDAG